MIDNGEDPTHIGTYRILRRLGAGGMGVVYLAHDRAGHEVAVKVVHAALAEDPQFRNRFRAEVARARQVPPFSTAEVLDADADAARPYLVVEYVNGPSLVDEVRRNGPLTPANLYSVAIGVATALTAIHDAGVIHRDLKPHNVLLAPGSPKVIDFGIASALASTTQLTRTGEVMGTVNYMAPERFDENRTPLTPAIDVFSWGCVVAFAGTGRAPFDGDSPAVTFGRILKGEHDLSDLHGPLRHLVERALTPDPRQRPTARELLNMLLTSGTAAEIPPAARRQAALAPEQPTVEPAGRAAVPATLPVPRRRIRRPAVLGLGLALALLLTAGGLVTRQAADAAETPAGNEVTATDVRLLSAAATSCPSLTPARLAGQVMVASQFADEPVPELRARGATGVAGLSVREWQDYAPWTGADPADRAASITALAHVMCQLSAQTRVLVPREDPWRAALAVRESGMDKVLAAGGVPDVAREHVETVERYATWYALQPAFGGAAASPSARPATGAVVRVPDAYLKEVLAAGQVCAGLSPARVTAQLMVASGFDPARLGPTGEQGIAQFRPAVWKEHAPTPAKTSPWNPVLAIRALGTTMCELLAASDGDYPKALTIFTGSETGSGGVTTADAVAKAEIEYAKDTRLTPTKATNPEKSVAPSPAPSASAKAPAKSPPVKGSSSDPTTSYGPYFLHNLALDMCADLPGTGPGQANGPVQVYGCSKGSDDNQEWLLHPKGADAEGYQRYWIQSTADGYCVDPPDRGTVPEISAIGETMCLDDDNQYFRLEPRLTSAGRQYYWLRNTVTDMCLEVLGEAEATPETQLYMVSCKAGDDHEWALVRRAEW